MGDSRVLVMVVCDEVAIIFRNVIPAWPLRHESKLVHFQEFRGILSPPDNAAVTKSGSTVGGFVTSESLQIHFRNPEELGPRASDGHKKEPILLAAVLLIECADDEVGIRELLLVRLP